MAETAAELGEKVADALERYPAGMLVEEYIAGRDITVPFLAAVQNEFGGVLAPVEYVIDPKLARVAQVRHLRLRAQDHQHQGGEGAGAGEAERRG